MKRREKRSVLRKRSWRRWKTQRTMLGLMRRLEQLESLWLPFVSTKTKKTLRVLRALVQADGKWQALFDERPLLLANWATVVAFEGEEFRKLQNELVAGLRTAQSEGVLWLVNFKRVWDDPQHLSLAGTRTQQLLFQLRLGHDVATGKLETVETFPD